MSNVQSPQPGPDQPLSRLKVLTPAQIQRIDELLNGVGEYGEVHLIVQHSQLRYINQVRSYKTWDETPPKK